MVRLEGGGSVSYCVCGIGEENLPRRVERLFELCHAKLRARNGARPGANRRRRRRAVRRRWSTKAEGARTGRPCVPRKQKPIARRRKSRRRRLRSGLERVSDGRLARKLRAGARATASYALSAEAVAVSRAGWPFEGKGQSAGTHGPDTGADAPDQLPTGTALYDHIQPPRPGSCSSVRLPLCPLLQYHNAYPFYPTNSISTRLVSIPPPRHAGALLCIRSPAHHPVAPGLL
jgi:hypothetical protein